MLWEGGAIGVVEVADVVVAVVEVVVVVAVVVTEVVEVVAVAALFILSFWLSSLESDCKSLSLSSSHLLLLGGGMESFSVDTAVGMGEVGRQVSSMGSGSSSGYNAWSTLGGSCSSITLRQGKMGWEREPSLHACGNICNTGSPVHISDNPVSLSLFLLTK